MPVKAPARRRPAPAAQPTAVPAAAASVVAPSVAPLHLPRPEGWWRSLALVLAFFEPAAGLLLALLYWRLEEPAVKRFSRWCLAVAILGALLSMALCAAKGGLDGGGMIQPY